MSLISKNIKIEHVIIDSIITDYGKIPDFADSDSVETIEAEYLELPVRVMAESCVINSIIISGSEVNLSLAANINRFSLDTVVPIIDRNSFTQCTA